MNPGFQHPSLAWLSSVSFNILLSISVQMVTMSNARNLLHMTRCSSFQTQTMGLLHPSVWVWARNLFLHNKPNNFRSSRQKVLFLAFHLWLS